MPDPPSIDQDFISQLTAVIMDHISDEQFGVSELADKMSMSRSNLLRKIKKATGQSVSQFIRQVRLEEGMKLLKETALTVSEVSYQVGFGSVSYFIKCFHDYYGYPPGEAGKGAPIQEETATLPPIQTHQLAAIMFTDIQGYTALMQQDEAQAIAFRNRHREVFNAATKKYHGKILQYYGDGTLSTFSSAIDAVRCGIEMQLAFRSEPHIPVRIGIHTGDILVSKDDIIGDGVNVAARIESLAAAGSVFISAKVYDEVKNQTGIQTTFMGTFELKNVAKPREVYAIANPGLFVPEKDQISGKGKPKVPDTPLSSGIRGKRVGIQWVLIPLLVMLIAFVIYALDIFDLNKRTLLPASKANAKKSIAVLPFINDSNDSTNIYIINGLMESILNNLQTIEDLRVISRTSVEKYRNNPKTIPEIARELNVMYLVEGSGQKIGNQILLNVQLIDATTDKHLWAEQYNREVKDIFALQRDVAKTIATNIQVIITPEEEERIGKPPTEDPVAYDYFLKGLDLTKEESRPALEAAIPYFEKAIEQDPGFARAYAAIAICYYYLDILQADKEYSQQLSYYADKALLLDPNLAQSLLAKAFYFFNQRTPQQALPYLEKALKYNPNSPMVINTLADYYTRYSPNTEKYLEYAIKGIGLNIGSSDSVTASFTYLTISNAFAQSGFIEEAEWYINQSLSFNSDNLFSAQVQAYITYAKTRNLRQTKDLLLEAYAKDTTRLDVLQEVGKIYYYMRDFEQSLYYYQKFIDLREALAMDIYQGEHPKIAVVFAETGNQEMADRYMEEFKAYADNEKSIYQPLSQTVYYAYRGDSKQAIEYMKRFAQEDNYHYWTVLFLPIEPLLENIKDLPEYEAAYEALEAKFWDQHNRIDASLRAKGVF